MKRGLARESTVALILVALFLLIFALYATKAGGAEGVKLIGDVGYVIYGAIAVVMGIIATRAYTLKSPQGKLLALLTATIALDVIAGVFWSYYELGLGIDSPFPTIADYVWLLYYIVGIIALVYALRRVWQFVSWKALGAGIVGAAVILFMMWQYALSIIFADTTQSALNKFLSAQYPIGDIVHLFLAFLMFTTLRKGMFGTSWLAFILGFAAYAIGDLNYSYQQYQGTYATGNLVDVFWFAGQLIWAYGFFLQWRAVQSPAPLKRV